jgi:single-stranded-DNA-specific exonuclease
MGDELFTPTIVVDAEVDLGEITPDVLHYLSRFPPYGPSNPKPIFSTREKLPIQGIRTMRKNTLKFMITENTKTYEAIGFGMGDQSQQLTSEVSIAFHPRINEWQGRQRLQLELTAFETDTDG